MIVKFRDSGVCLYRLWIALTKLGNVGMLT